MSYLAIMFIVFSVGFSWFSGDKKNDQLIDQLEESAYEQRTMSEQVRQSKLKASVDAKKLSELSQKITKLSKEKDKVERKFERSKLRRARLLRPQIAKIKAKVEAPYKVKINKMQKVVKIAKADMAKLRAENDKLKRQYRELIRKNKERVSEIDDPRNSPLTRGEGLDRLPVTRGGGLDRSPVSRGDGLDRSPVSRGDGLDRSPVSRGDGLDRSPITRGDGLDRSPITREDGLERSPITREDGLERSPITKEDGLERSPITKEDGLERSPITKGDDLERSPITREGLPAPLSRGDDLERAPFTKEGLPAPFSKEGIPVPLSKEEDLLPVVPEEELVELDNGQLVKLDNIDRREKIPASRDLVSAAEVLKEADASSEFPRFIRAEQVNVKEGWL